MTPPTYYGLKDMCVERNIEINRVIDDHRYDTAIRMVVKLREDIINTQPDKPTTLDESRMSHEQRLVFHTLVNAGCKESIAMDTSLLVKRGLK